MEVREYLKIIRQSSPKWPSWGKNNLEKRLFALDQIAKIGGPSLIIDLIPLLKDVNEKIRQASLSTIRVLFYKLKTKNAFYQSLKYSPISKSDLKLYEGRFATLDLNLIYSLASLNHDGYVRELALQRLEKFGDEESLPFIIYRLADWVPEVRQIAEQALRKFLNISFLPAIINNISLFVWLRMVGRTQISNEVIDFIVNKNREKVLALFSNLKDKERLVLAKELCQNTLTKTEFDKYLSDSHFLIRRLMLPYFDSLTDTQKHLLLQDKNASLRLQSLYCIVEYNDFQDQLTDYIADKSSNIRYFARHYLKDEGIDFKSFYITKLENKKQIIGALLGLSELGVKDHKELIASFLDAPKVRIAKTAFNVLTELHPNVAYDFAKENLFTEKAGLRRLLFDFLAKENQTEVLGLARVKYQDTNDTGLKLAILRLLSQIGGYTTLPDLLQASIDSSEIIRQQAAQYLQRWKVQAPNSFRRPKGEEKENLLDFFQLINKEQEEKNYFKINPLNGIDYYLN